MPKARIWWTEKVENADHPSFKTRVIRPGDPDWTDAPDKPGDVPRPPVGASEPPRFEIEEIA